MKHYLYKSSLYFNLKNTSKFYLKLLYFFYKISLHTKYIFLYIRLVYQMFYETVKKQLACKSLISAE